MAATTKAAATKKAAKKTPTKKVAKKVTKKVTKKAAKEVTADVAEVEGEAVAKKATKKAAKKTPVKRTKRKAKYITIYSPFLMKDTKHELIGEPMDTDGGRTQWARCSVSHHSQLINLDALQESAEKAMTQIKLAREDSREYSPKLEYQVGDVIYHKVWDDVGIVRAKEVMSNGRASLVVHFENSKDKRLVENLK